MRVLAITPQIKHDYLVAAIIEGLKQSNIELFCTSKGNGAVNIITDEDFIRLYDSCDIILAFSSKCIFNNVLEPKYYLIDKVNGWHKTAYIDGSEYNYTSFRDKTAEQLHPKFKLNARWYFKRECTLDHIDKGIIPLPFAAIESDFLNINVDKTIDVLCSFGQISTGLRRVAVKVCEELKHEGYNIITTTADDYLTKIHQSWITIDAHGGGECNARMWQIMSNKSCLFAQKYNIIYPYLDEGEHYVAWTDEENLKNKIRYFLKNKEKLSYIIKNSYKNIIQHHTSEKRVAYIFNKIKK